MLNEPRPSSQELDERHRILQLIQRGMVEGIRREVEYRRAHGLPIIVQRNGKIEDIGSTSQNSSEDAQGPE